VTPRYGPVLNLRFGLLAVCCIVMLLTALMNRRAGWMSMGLFLAALACLLAAWQLQRRMPVKRRD
jgi:hypothetical protein